MGATQTSFICVYIVPRYLTAQLSWHTRYQSADDVHASVLVAAGFDDLLNSDCFSQQFVIHGMVTSDRNWPRC